MLHVVAGIIEIDGKVLLCQRHQRSKRFPLKWEFPGGKVEKDETPEAAIIRELNEELDIDCKIIEKIITYRYAYNNEQSFQLHFFKIKSYGGSIKNLQFENMLWVKPEDISNYDILDGDKPFLKHWTLSAER